MPRKNDDGEAKLAMNVTIFRAGDAYIEVADTEDGNPYITFSDENTWTNPTAKKVEFDLTQWKDIMPGLVQVISGLIELNEGEEGDEEEEDDGR